MHQLIAQPGQSVNPTNPTNPTAAVVQNFQVQNQQNQQMQQPTQTQSQQNPQQPTQLSQTSQPTQPGQSQPQQNPQQNPQSSPGPFELPVKIDSNLMSQVHGIISGQNPPASLKFSDIPNLIQFIGQQQTRDQHTGTVTSTDVPQGYNPQQSYGYIPGQCTAFASWYLQSQGINVPNMGNAKTWPLAAQKAGLTVTNTPTIGSVVCWPNLGNYGHVGVVTGVNSDGTINVQESNYSHPNQTDQRSNVSPAGTVYISK